MVTTAATTTVARATEAGTTELSHAGRLAPLEPEAAGTYVGELFAEHGRMVLGLCRLLLRDPVEAEDAAQQVFVSAHHALLRGSVPRDSAAWMAAIARNECRSRIRACMGEPLELPELASDLPDPLASAIRAADLAAIGRPSARCRAASGVHSSSVSSEGSRITSSGLRSASRTRPWNRSCSVRDSRFARSSRERTPWPCRLRCGMS